MYNAEDGEGCLRLFLSTGESLLAITPLPAVAKAISRVEARAAGSASPLSLQERVWLLRKTFDDILDELDATDPAASVVQ